MYICYLQYVATLILQLVALAYGLDTYHCIHGTSVDFNLSNGTARIVTRLSGTSIYGNNMACFWSVSTDTNKRLYFKVVDSDLQYAPDNANCFSYDYMAFKEEYIADDYDWSHAELGMYFTWCGDRNPRYFSSKDSNVYLEFHSDDRNTYTYRGITIEVTAFDITDCPPGWSSETSRQTDYCYTLREHKETWSDAQLSCNKVQSNLVSIGDNTEVDFVTALMQNASGFERHENTWIGLNDIIANSQYKWIDEITSTATYRWRSVPHSSSVYDNCVSMTYHDGGWQEEFCTLSDIQTVTKNKFICKTKKGKITPLYKVPSTDTEEPTPDAQGAPLGVIVIIFILTAIFILVTVIAVVFLIMRTRSRRQNQRKNHEPVATEMGGLDSGGGGSRPAVSGNQQPQPSAPLMNSDNNDDWEVAPPSYNDVVAS